MTSTSTTTSTTLGPRTSTCDCEGYAFLVEKRGKFNHEGLFDGNIGANDPLRGLVKFGRNALMPNGSSVSAETVLIGSGTSLFDVDTNNLRQSLDATIRGTLGPVSTPLVDPFCELPEPIVCNGNHVIVPERQEYTLVPGVYGNLFVGNAATLLLPQVGTYTFCSIKIGRQVRVEASRATINVTGKVKIGQTSFVGTASGEPITFYSIGTKFQISQTAMVQANVTMPGGKFKVGTGGTLSGCFCASQAVTGKLVNLICTE